MRGSFAVVMCHMPQLGRQAPSSSAAVLIPDPHPLTCPGVCLRQASLADFTVVDYVAEDPLIKGMGVTKDQVAEGLKSVGFSDELRVRGGQGASRSRGSSGRGGGV